MLQGCLPAITTMLTANTSTVILVIIVLLSVESIVIILAVCLCSLQHTGSHKNIHTVLVRGQGGWKSDKCPYPPDLCEYRGSRGNGRDGCCARP